jgi:hypothetical protein
MGLKDRCTVCFHSAVSCLRSVHWLSAVKGIDLSIAYAVWGGFGIIATVTTGWVLFDQQLNRKGWPDPAAGRHDPVKAGITGILIQLFLLWVCLRTPLTFRALFSSFS